MTFSIKTTSSEETESFGAAFAKALTPGSIVLLNGTLGMGKTTFVRGMLKALGWREVRSPSFTLVNEYDSTIPVAHADLYRLEKVDFRDLGLDEYSDDGWVVVIEWPERLTSVPKLEGFSVFFKGDEDDVSLRTIEVDPLDDVSRDLFDSLDLEDWRH